MTRGSAPRNHTWEPDLKPNFLLTVSELVDHPEEKAKGIAVCTHPDLRWKRCDIKSLNLLPNVLARQDAVERATTRRSWSMTPDSSRKGAGSAFFAISKRALQTAPLSANILPSITRQVRGQGGQERRHGQSRNAASRPSRPPPLMSYSWP